MASANPLTQGMLGQTYKITIVDLVHGVPEELYVASVEGLRSVPLWQVAREIKACIEKRSILVAIEELDAEVLVLDMRNTAETRDRTR